MKKLIVTKKESFLKIAFYVLKWHINYLLKRRNRPLAIGVFLTNRCNLRCQMCSIWRSQKKSQLSMEDIRKIVKAISPGCCYFSFSGGEPLLVEGIYDMISYASSRIPYVHLVSNGMLIDKRVAEGLSGSGLSEVSLSLDGEEDYHNHLREAVNSYKKVIQAVENLKNNAPKIKIVLNTVIFPGHLEQVKHVIDLARKLNVYAKVQPVNKHFDFSDVNSNPAEINFERQDPKELLDLVQDLIKARHILNSRFYLKNIPAYFAEKSQCSLIRPICRVPYYFLEVNSHRIVSPCMIGTGWEEGLTIEEYMKKDAKFGEAQRKLEVCRKCDKSMYICYWETMVNIPVINFLKHNFLYI